MQANIKSINPHFNGLLGFTLVTVRSLKHSHGVSLLIADVKRFLEGFPFFPNYEYFLKKKVFPLLKLPGYLDGVIVGFISRQQIRPFVLLH